MDRYVPKKHLERRRLGARLKLYLIVGAGLLLVFFGIYLVAYSAMFRVQLVSVTGANEIDSEFIAAAGRRAAEATTLGKIFGSDHMFSWPTDIILPGESRIASAAIRKQYIDRSIEIIVSERTQYGIWCGGVSAESATCYWFGKDGIVLGPAPKTEGALIIRINEIEPITVSTGGPILAPAQFENLLAIIRILEDRGIGVSELTLSRARQEVTTRMPSGTKLVFSLRFPPSESITRFLDVNLESGVLQRMEYVDFTVE